MQLLTIFFLSLYGTIIALLIARLLVDDAKARKLQLVDGASHFA